ncbi:lipid-A-disaccharide synthase [candidate division KSB1 bacterium]|nr:lipid-A-disaccharide synthase [candidate division KSB1 bacterium]
MSHNDIKHTIMIVAGEASGDLHASALVHEMHRGHPDLRFIGIGGDKMKNQGVELLYHINEMSVLGFGDVIKHFPFLRRVFKSLVSEMEQRKPDLIILIDYPGLNFKFAREARRLSIPVFYYIAPQVWAWGTGRLKKMSRLIDKMAVILPFEQDLFTNAGVDATFVGHPLLDSFGVDITRAEFLSQHNLSENDRIIGLLPGSRTHEVKRLLPIMLETARLLNSKHRHLKFLVAQSPTISDEIYENTIHDLPNVKFVSGETYRLMHFADFLIVKSGTSTLETALAQTPFIIVYKVDPFSYYLGKLLVKIKHIGLVNVIAGDCIVPEFIQHDCTAKNMIPTIETLLYNKDKREIMKMEFARVKKLLGDHGASARAAELALSVMQK